MLFSSRRRPRTGVLQPVDSVSSSCSSGSAGDTSTAVRCGTPMHCGACGTGMPADAGGTSTIPSPAVRESCENMIWREAVCGRLPLPEVGELRRGLTFAAAVGVAAVPDATETAAGESGAASPGACDRGVWPAWCELCHGIRESASTPAEVAVMIRRPSSVCQGRGSRVRVPVAMHSSLPGTTV